MHVVTVIAQKGGAGKTTIAINLAVAAEACGWRTALVDLDPQASAAGWGDHRERDLPLVAAVPAAGVAAAAVSEGGLELAPCRLGGRVAFQHSLTRGLGVLEHEPRGKAAAEVEALFGWVRQRLES